MILHPSGHQSKPLSGHTECFELPPLPPPSGTKIQIQQQQTAVIKAEWYNLLLLGESSFTLGDASHSMLGYGFRIWFRPFKGHFATSDDFNVLSGKL
jgi:hypothetical protein